MLTDIRKAFLMIWQNPKKHKNRFCIFLLVGDELICFKYTTLIFRLNASPFIHNFVLKHHTDRFPTNSCTEILRNKLQVDNLC